MKRSAVSESSLASLDNRPILGESKSFKKLPDQLSASFKEELTDSIHEPTQHSARKIPERYNPFGLVTSYPTQETKEAELQPWTSDSYQNTRDLTDSAFVDPQGSEFEEFLQSRNQKPTQDFN